MKEPRASIVQWRKEPTLGGSLMLDRFARLLEVSTTVAAIALTLIAAQLATQVYAFVDLVRRDAVRGGRKWVWALVIALGNLPGAIAYLAAGRLTSEVDVASAGAGVSATNGEAARRAMDVLYKPRDQH